MSNGKVTLKDLYEINNEVLDKMEGMRKEIMSCVSKNTQDISALNYWKAEFMGKVTIVVGVVAICISLITDWVKKRLDL